MEFVHRSVLLWECIDALNIKPDGIYLDGTLGGAGHSSQIAQRLTTGRLIGVDRDTVAMEAAKLLPPGAAQQSRTLAFCGSWAHKTLSLAAQS